ncbi:signal peptidase I [Kaarinaea lacus]
MKIWFYQTMKENKGLFLFIILMSVFRSGVADWNVVPTGSMKPTILEGDRILVNKMAYDIRIPFTHISLIKRSDPERGDIVIFDSAQSDKRLVKRVIGVPGDIVEMTNNVLTINGQDITYHDVALSGDDIDKVENLMGSKHLIRINEAGNKYFSTFKAVSVPENHYLVLGDNRDNSADSRVIGFVPRDEIVGRSRDVVLSLNYDNFYMPRPERFFHSLDAD